MIIIEKNVGHRLYVNDQKLCLQKHRVIFYETHCHFQIHQLRIFFFFFFESALKGIIKRHLMFCQDSKI